MPGTIAQVAFAGVYGALDGCTMGCNTLFDRLFGWRLDGKRAPGMAEVEKKCFWPLGHCIGSYPAANDSLPGAASIDHPTGISWNVEIHGVEDFLGEMRACSGCFINIGPAGVVVLMEDERQVEVRAVDDFTLCGNVGDCFGTMVAAVQVDAVSIGAFVMSESPGVEAGKECQVEGLKIVPVMAHPREKSFGGCAFITVNARREIEAE